MNVLHLCCHLSDLLKNNVLLFLGLRDLDHRFIVCLLENVWLESVGVCGLNEGEEEYPIFYQP